MAAPPPLSLRGIYGSLRAPRLRDFAYSAKAFTAVALALTIGFSQNLENPYWSVLTVYIIMVPPGAGAIRSKCLFRLLGTVIGGVAVIVATALFGDEIGILLTAIIGVIVGAMFLNQLDKTPSGYIWFAVAVTSAVIALSNLEQPGRIFDLATQRVGEIVLGILMVAAVDSVWPEPMTPGFLKTMADWRGEVRAFAAETFRLHQAPSGDEVRRRKLRDLVKGIQAIDAKAIQLPFDVVPRAPRPRDLDLVRRQVVATVGDLVAAELRARKLREADALPLEIDGLLGSLAAWLGEEDDPAGLSDDAALDRHVERGRALGRELESARGALDAAPGRDEVVERGLLSRLAAFVADWCDLLLAIRAVETGRRLPPRLEAVASHAKPVRSVDYLGIALDVAPLALAMTVSSVIWYLTAWDDGPTALLFSFAGCIFLVGQSQILESTVGFLTCMLISFALVFFYQYAVLPRVTDFPVLLMVLGCVLLPVGVLMSMSLAGMLIAALTFSFLGLQSAYAADFQQSLQTLTGSLVGLLIAVVCLRLCAYDHARFATRRLAAAVRRDVLDVASAARTPEPDRFSSLSLYRLSQYFPAAEAVSDGGRLPRLGLLGDLSVGSNLLKLRRSERAVSAGVRNLIRSLRGTAATTFRDKLAGRGDDGELRSLVDRALADPAVRAEPAHDALLDALAGLHLALSTWPPAAPTAARPAPAG